MTLDRVKHAASLSVGLRVVVSPKKPEAARPLFIDERVEHCRIERSHFAILPRGELWCLRRPNRRPYGLAEDERESRQSAVCSGPSIDAPDCPPAQHLGKRSTGLAKRSGQLRAQESQPINAEEPQAGFVPRTTYPNYRLRGPSRVFGPALDRKSA